MKVILDTNVVISGLLWGGPPNQLLKWGRERLIRIQACGKTMDELERVLSYGKFAKRLTALQHNPSDVMSYFRNLVDFVAEPQSVPSVVAADPFDNIFLALAIENNAVLIVSGDRHLLDLERFQNIDIVMPSHAVEVIATLKRDA